MIAQRKLTERLVLTMNKKSMSWWPLAPGQVAQVQVYDLATGKSTTIYEDPESVVEAPNWTADGQSLVINRDGDLFTVPASGGGRTQIDTAGQLGDANNDHVLAPDGKHLYVSENDGHIYRVALAGGEVAKMTDAADGLSARYLHGVSPDGRNLVFIGGPVTATLAPYNIYVLEMASGELTQLTHAEKRHDGAEYSPDGEWIYFNSERNSIIPGHCQIFRMRPDGSGVEQLTSDARVNWFPHPSPDGQKLVYLSYPPLTDGHPSNLPIQLFVTDPLCQQTTAVIDLFGGQGTINTPSWHPDSTKFAYVAYPVLHPPFVGQ